MIPKKLGPHVRYSDPRILPFLLKSRETDDETRSLLLGKARWENTDTACGIQYWCGIHAIEFRVTEGVATISLEAEQVDPEVAQDTARIVAEQGLDDLPAIFLSLRHVDGGLVGDVRIYQGDVIGESRQGKSPIYGLHHDAYVIGRRDVLAGHRLRDVDGERRYDCRGVHPLPAYRHIHVGVELATCKHWAREVNHFVDISEGWKRQEAARKSARWRARKSREAVRAMEDDEGLVSFSPPDANHVGTP